MKVNKFIGLVVAGIIAVSSLACGGEDNEDVEEDRIVVYNTSYGEYLYDKKFKFFGKWETAKENKEKERFVPDAISLTSGYPIVNDRYFDNECDKKIPLGTYAFNGNEILEGYLERVSQNDENDESGIYHDYVERYEQLDRYDGVNIENKNRNIVEVRHDDNNYCYLTWEEEEIDYYEKDPVKGCVKFENDMAEVNSGNSFYKFMIVVDSNDIECFSYDDLIERKKTY